MKVLIDADGCPVVKQALSIAEEYGIEVLLVCDAAHDFSYEKARVLVTTKGADAADFLLVNHVKQNDIVITQDYGLASMVLAKKGSCINQNGLIYSQQNIDQLLFSRHVSKVVRRAGGRVKGPKKRTNAQNEQFMVAYRRLIEQTLERIKQGEVNE